MNLQEQERAAEQWLDEAIGYLRDTGPRRGLETRVLAGLRAHAEQRRRRWALVVAASAAAVLLAGLVASWPRSKPEATPDVAQQSPPAPVNTASAPAISAVKEPLKTNRPQTREHGEGQAQSTVRRVVAVTAVEARPEIFPTPAPLTEQGKLLQAYLRQTPPQELALVAARLRPAGEIEDLRISPLEIKDLTPKAEAERDQD
jgi:hypothetical protein